MIKSLNDRAAYHRRVQLCWEKNSEYWVSSPHRHVTDVGKFIVENVIRIASEAKKSKPTILDMGFGSAWLYQALRDRKFPCNYIGFDSNNYFISYARNKFSADKFCRFELVDVEEPLDIDIKADLIVNAFNLFELADLKQPMKIAYDLLFPGGRFMISTIDLTYLILAISKSWSEFFQNLRLYEELPGVKYAFQPIDFGDRASDILEYPSVLYSRDDYLTAAKNAGFLFASYKENVFTSKPVPKIYYHLEFEKGK